MPAEYSLEDLERVLKRNNRLVAALLLLFIGLVVAGCVYAVTQAQRLLRPETLAAEAVREFEEHYPEIRPALKEEIVKAAPQLAEKVSDEVVASIPEARAELETHLEREMDAALDRASRLSAEEFRQLLRENRTAIERAVFLLHLGPFGMELLVDQLDRLIRRSLESQLQEEARLVLGLLRDVNAKLALYARQDDVGLSPAQRVERRMVRILRTIQAEGARANGTGS